MGDLSGNLVPSVTNFNSEQNKMKSNEKKIKPRGQHHPGMTVAEIGLQGAMGANRKKEESDKKEQAKEKAKVRDSSVLTSLGDLVRNVSSTLPFFV